MILQTIISTERGAKATILRLECGHDRSIGSNMFRADWAVGEAHLMTGLQYPCRDGLCGSIKP